MAQDGPWVGAGLTDMGSAKAWFSLCRQTQARSPELLSLDPHVILDRLHPFDVASNLDRPIDVGLGSNEAAELHHTLEGFDVDLGRFQGRLIENFRLHLRGNGRVIDIFTGPLLLRRRCATHERSQKDCYEENR